MKHRIVCLLADGFEDSEYTVPVERLRAAGYAVDVVGLRKGQALQGKAGQATAAVTCAIDEASAANYMGMLIPGGKSPAALGEDPRVVSFVKAFAGSKKPIAAICHGPQLLVRAGVVKGRTLTAYRGVHAELQEAGATVRDEAMVADGNFITSRTPADLEPFCTAMLTQFDVNADQSWMARGDVHAQ